ncbi:MAG: zinc ABC transporter substrate-binding protein [Hungatella sp.]|nr:zinc ABC transporter substrate-binding protein [Hungatella sp.]
MGRTGKILALAAAAALALALAGCGQGSDSREPGNGNTGERPLKVAATLFPYYDFARQIGGDVIDLELIVPAGMDSHSFEPTPADMRKFEEADVVILNGGVMEHWAQQVLESVGREDQTVVFMMDYVEAVEEELVEGMEESGHSHSHGASHDGHEEGHFHDDGHQEDIEYDEHIWTSPVNAIRFVEVITRVLCQEDPDHQAEFEAGRDRYVKELEEIHEGFCQVAADRKRNLIVVGDRFPFRYLADQYGFEYRAAFSGCGTDTEPSARTIAYLIDKVEQEGVPAVYYLELSSHRVSEIIGEETGAVPLLLHSCHNVTRSELESGVTYVELMRQNIENLRKGLDED